jgi:hypothetical protein
MSGAVGFGNFTYAPEATSAARNADFYVLDAAADGVTQIVAGNSSITVSPAGGTGVVTLTVPPPIFPPSGFVAGMIMMWTGVTAPTGWAICDGTNGTPDLREKFIRGSSLLVPIGSTGGATSVTLTTGNLASHSHTLTNGTANVAAVCNTIAGGGGGTGIVNNQISRPSGEAVNSASATISGSTDTAGTADPFNILPPFYALAYIIKT